MRRLFVALLAVLEFAVAIVLVVTGLRLPSRHDVSGQFDSVGKVTGGTETQVRIMKDQVADLRKQDLGTKAEQLRLHTNTAAEAADKRNIDFRTVEAIARSLGDVAKGLNAWADTVDAERLLQVGKGLRQTADYIDTGVVDPSEKSAADLEKTLGALEKDAARLAELLRASKPDLKSAKTIHDGLGSFDLGLDKLGELIKPDQLKAMKEGLLGMETSLTATADQVDKVSALTYPVVTFDGLKANVEQKPFWPDGAKVSEGLRKSIKGVQASTKEMELMEKNLPAVQKSLADSRTSVKQTRDSLGAALKHQAEAEKLLGSVPEQTAVLAEALPKMGRTLSTMLKETKKLRDLAIGLRQVQRTLEDTLNAWPEVAKGLKKSAAVLDQAKRQLDEAALNRVEYEKAMESSSRVARSLADLLPAFTDKLDGRLGQQEAALERMESGLTEVNESLPAMEAKTSELVRTVEVLLYLAGLLVGLHGVYVMGDVVRVRVVPVRGA